MSNKETAREKIWIETCRANGFPTEVPVLHRTFFDAGYRAARSEVSACGVSRSKLRDDIDERLDIAKEFRDEEQDVQTRAYLDGQVYVLERILSDIDFGLWQAPEAGAWNLIRSAEDLPPQDGTEWWCTFSGYNGKPEVHKGRVDCAGTRWLLSLTLSVPWDRVVAIMPIAKPPPPYTADSGKEKGD